MSFARHPAISASRDCTSAANARRCWSSTTSWPTPKRWSISPRARSFGDVASYYPGIRAKVPLTFQQFILDELRGEFAELFGLRRSAPAIHGLPLLAGHHAAREAHLSAAHSAHRFAAGNELAFIHYLFKADLGGTAFYRHRKTGFESSMRAQARILAPSTKKSRPPSSAPAPDTSMAIHALYEGIGRQEGRIQPHADLSAHFAAFGGFVPGLRRQTPIRAAVAFRSTAFWPEASSRSRGSRPVMLRYAAKIVVFSWLRCPIAWAAICRHAVPYVP